MYGGSGVRFAHVLVSGPFLIYVGLVRPQAAWIYRLLMVAGFVVLVAFLATKPRLPLGVWDWKHILYVAHVMLFSMLLIYVGLMGPSAAPLVFVLLVAIGIGSMLHHMLALHHKV